MGSTSASFDGSTNSGFQNGINNGTINVFKEDGDNECLSALLSTYPSVSDPGDHMREIEEAKGGLLKDSYEWIIHHPSFRQVQFDDQKRLLWIRGEPGHGKTMLLMGMIKELDDSSPQAGLAYFFCQGTNVHMNSATAVLRGLIYRLIMIKTSLITHLRERYDRHKGVFQDGSSFFALSHIAGRMLRDPKIGRAFIVIDALDECETSQDRLLKFIAVNISASPSVKWIVSSRNVPTIIDQFDQLGQKRPELRIHLDLVDNPDEVSQAVNAYIDSRIEKLQVLRDSQHLRAQVRDIMRDKAADTFLWVALVAKELERVWEWDVLEVLANIPSGLEGVYDRMMRHIKNLSMKNPVLCYQVLATATLAYRPLRLAEMGILAGLPDGIRSNPDNVKKIVTICGSFFRIQDNFIQFIHQSAKDYLKKNASEVLFAPVYGITHLKMCSNSIETLSQELKRNIYKLETPGTLTTEIKVPEPDPLRAVRYSCVHWVNHLCDWSEIGTSLDNALQDDGSVHGFLKNHLLHWLEASSLIGSIGETIHAVVKLQTLLKESVGKSALMDLADDVHRFVLKNGTIIQMAPLQAYLSALLFTPGETLTRRLFAKQVPRWILREPIVDKKWGSVIHSLENKHELKSLAFSHDSKILALQLYRVVQLWDVSTGLLRAELSTGLSAVSSQLCAMKFSHDSRLLASVPFPGDVFIWEVHTGIQKHRIPCPAKVDTLTFSPDSNLLALCYSSSSEIWDTNTWTLTKKVSCMPHFEWSRGSACFSPNLNVFVPPPRNGKIELRDTDTCSLRQTFGTGDELSKIAFSPEGKLLASGSEDGTIRIWNVMSSSLERTIRDHTRRIVFINFSHDSQTFVSVSFDGLIYVRNTITWSVIPTIDGQYSRRINPGVMSVSNDCKLLAFAGKTIQIWDMARSPLKHQVDQPRTTKNFLPISSKNPKPIISEDLKRSSLASVVGSHTLTVRNTSTGAIEREFEFNRLGGLLVGWSHDLSMFAWVTKSGTTKIGKLFSGETKQVFTHLGGPIKRAVFSYDCQNVAFISGREASTSITIWNVVTGQKVLSFPSMYEKPKFVALSHDSRYLAAAYLLSKVKIWDLGKPIGTAPVKEILSKTLEWPGALAFSHDSRLLAVAQGIASFREDSSISIWDTSTMTLRQTIITDTVAESLSFSSDGSFLNTDRCCLVVRSNEPDCTHPGGGGIMMNPKRVGFYFSDDFSWIELHGKKMIYIPADYRRNLDHPKTISAIYRSDHPPANTTIAYSIQAEKDWLIELAETESSFV